LIILYSNNSSLSKTEQDVSVTEFLAISVMNLITLIVNVGT